mgnify:CR=1 FL=1
MAIYNDNDVFPNAHGRFNNPPRLNGSLAHFKYAATGAFCVSLNFPLNLIQSGKLIPLCNLSTSGNPNFFKPYAFGIYNFFGLS